MLEHLNQPRLDSAESAFFNRQLEFIYTQTYDIKFGAIKHTQFIPLSTQANEGSVQVTYRQFTEVGTAKFISHNSKDVPRVDVNGVEFPRPVRWPAASYGWTIMDVKAAAMANINLQPRRAATARRAVERLVDLTVFSGAPLEGIATGWANDTNITIDPAAGVWSAATADVIISEVSDMLQGIVGDSLGEEQPNVLVLPDPQWAVIATLPRSTNSDKTVLKFIEEAFDISIEKWHRLTGAGAGGVNRAVLYDRSPNILTHEMPMAFTQIPVQEQGLEFVVNALAATAGTAWYYPLAGRYLDGI